MIASIHSVALALPDGRALFQNLNLELGHGKTGLVGPNGVGKTLLARLLCGEVEPSRGAVRATPRPLLFRQLAPPPEISLGEYLFDVWSLADDDAISLRDEFLSALSLQASCSSLSGGEWTRARLLRALTENPGFIILDEPTNNLDRSGREAVARFVERTRTDLLVISHDRGLLTRMDRILELSNRGIATYGGGWDFYEHARRLERQAREREAARARWERERAERERDQKVEAQARRQRHAARRAPRAGIPKIALGMMKRRAENTAAKLDVQTQSRARQAEIVERLAASELKFDPRIYAEFPAPDIPAGKPLVEADRVSFRFDGADRDLWPVPLSFHFSGPARIRLSGGNGAGKSTLLRLLLGTDPPSGQVTGTLRLGGIRWVYLDQALSMLDGERSVLSCFVERTGMAERAARGILARFLFQGERARSPVAGLSGGERMRLALAVALSSRDGADLLVLDEPTNHVDLPNLEFLEEALSAYQGALIVVTHDDRFAKALGLDQEIRLGYSPAPQKKGRVSRPSPSLDS